MNKPLSLIFAIALSMPFVSCLEQTGGRRDTVFHSAEDSPRTGQQGSNRYGMNGTHSPTERSKKKTSSRNRRNTASNNSRSNRSNSDPDGIVKPRDLDPEPGVIETPEIVKNDPEPEVKTPEPPAPSGDAPYAEAVPGKTGLVYSPFVASKKDGLVNVTDENNVPLPPGTEVTDPHTGKTFRVP